MRINEIIKMPPIKNSNTNSMVAWAYNNSKSKGKKIGSLNLSYDTEIYKIGNNLNFFILSDGEALLYLNLDQYLDGYKVGVVSVEPKARGKNLAITVYNAASEFIKKPIYSDSTQTDASRIGIWKKLIKLYPNRIMGFDQKLKKDLPFNDGNVNSNQPIYVDRKSKNTKKALTLGDRSRTRLLKFMPQ